VYLLVDRGVAPPPDLADVAGVGGAWWGGAEPMDPPYTTTDNTGLQITYLFLDDEPAAVGRRLQPALEQRWSASDVVPLLAAPFHTLVPYDWERHLP
jgi:hypothetical protein